MPRHVYPRVLGPLLLLTVFLLAGLPVASLLMGAVRDGIGGGFTTSYLQKVFLTTTYVRPLVSTLMLAACVGLAATAMGALLGWTMSRLRLPGAGVIEIGLMLPIFISPFIGAIGWITLAQPNTGMLNVLFRSLHLPQVNVISFGGTVFIMALFYVPYTYTLVRHPMERLNPELEEAAAISGANHFRVLHAIVLPLLWPSLLSAMIIVFVLSAEMFSIPGLLLVPRGYNNLSYAIYDRTLHWPINQSEASAIGLILLIITIIGMIIYGLSVRLQERFITVGPKAPRQPTASGWTIWRWLALLGVIVYILLSSILPIAAIAVRAMLPFFSGDFSISALTLGNIRNTLSDQLAISSIWNSILVTVVSTILLMVIAFLVALERIRRPGPISTATWLMASIPIAVPGVLIGLGLIWLYIGTPVYATLLIIVLVMLARFLPILVRMFETGLIQFGRELEEAASVCGASDVKITRSIRLPLLGGTIRSAATIAGTQVFNELTASALLFTSTSSVLPVVIFNYMFDGDYSRASALALTQIAILCAGLALLSAFGAVVASWTRRTRRRDDGAGTPARLAQITENRAAG